MKEELPKNLQHWSWGAFLLGWIWAIGNRCWIGLLTLVPILGFFVAIMLGMHGRKWAWRDKEWKSLEHFDLVQKRWSKWAVISYVSLLSLGTITPIAISKYQDAQIKNQKKLEFRELSLGMKPVDVTLIKGKPSNQNQKIQKNDDGTYHMYWEYDYIDENANYLVDDSLIIEFYGEKKDDITTSRVCGHPKYISLDGFDNIKYANPRDLTSKLGQPEKISINKTGIFQILSYPKLNLSFEFEKGKLIQICLVDYAMSYLEEYKF